ncbi:hypothetical protein POSPLADRAFT_1154779 [Postia placenta MAD-698-R-SB12]|uniref:Uncharacterized protein n=1 Tax=Postia placenta MAD-698-R-SB12 TaxID=670580 RepID=A0A1X6MNZ8_9APHY|nr:hypothetical protein POSPLADRAFT_1154779 [Postia placenta MAD-698-R-SB12]OSX58085.1 hypothetical protein POSPLADRAFT_1154779 [Postia placenta MAD-698-R-SB12]
MRVAYRELDLLMLTNPVHSPFLILVTLFEQFTLYPRLHMDARMSTCGPQSQGILENMTYYEPDAEHMYSFADCDMFMRFRGGGIGHMAIAEVTERLLQESHEDMQDNLEGHPTDKPSIPDALRPARGRDQEYADVRHSEVVLGNPPNTLTVGMLCQEGPNNIQAEEADYGYIDNDAEDIDDGGEIGTDDEDALGPEDGEDDGGDDPCTVEGYASL